MSRVKSRDGTVIDHDRRGSGPPVVLVGDREENAPLAAALAGHFTVRTYDQRGRGASGDTPPYAVEREIEDLRAIIELAAGVCVYGVSSGGALALEAAAAGVPMRRLAVYEVPYGLTSPDGWRHYRAELAALLADGRNGDAFELFMRTAGSPEQDIEGARNAPIWPELEAAAPTLAYGAACLGEDGQPPVARLRGIAAPTLVMTGEGVDAHMSELPDDAFLRAAAAIADAVPGARRHTLPIRAHAAPADALAPVLTEFFTART